MARFPGRPVARSGPRFGGSRISYFETDDGPATYTLGQDGSPWLETQGGKTGGLDRFSNARPVYAQAAPTPAPANPVGVQARPRTLGERFTDTVEDTALRNPLMAIGRWATTRGPDTYTQIDPSSGQPIEFRTFGAQARDTERARRDAFDARVNGDGWRDAPGGVVGKGAAGVTTLGGALTGAFADPTNVLSGIIGGGRSVLGRIAVDGAVNAAADATGQAADVAAGVQDRYSPVQTAFAGALGAGIRGGFEAAPAVGRAAVRGGRFGGRLIANTAESLGRSIENPVPRFDGIAVDTGPITQPPANTPRRRAAPPAIQGVIDGAARERGLSADYMTRLAERESAFDPSARAGTSSATGLYQFTDRTWLGVLSKYGEELGVRDAASLARSNPDALLRLRTDPDLNARAAARLTEDNGRALAQTLGRAPTDAELYSAHFLGEGQARQLAMAADDALAANLFPEAARANRSIFFDGRRARTVAEVRADFARTFDGGPREMAAPISHGSGQAEQIIAERSRIEAGGYSPTPVPSRAPIDYDALARADLRREPLSPLTPLSPRQSSPMAAVEATRRPFAPRSVQPPQGLVGGLERMSLPEIAPPRLRGGPRFRGVLVGRAEDVGGIELAGRPPLQSLSQRYGQAAPEVRVPRMDLPERMAPADFTTNPARVSRIAPEGNYLSPGTEGFRVDLPHTQNRLGGVVSGDVRPDNTWRVRTAELPPAERGAGLAVQAYAKAAREAATAGARLTSDAEVTPAAARVWEGLQRRGFAVERNPLATLESRAGVPDTMGMGSESWRTPDGSPVFSVAKVPAASAVMSRPRFSGVPVEPQSLDTPASARMQAPGVATAPEATAIAPRFSGRPVTADLAETGDFGPLQTPDQMAPAMQGIGPDDFGPLAQSADMAAPVQPGQEFGPIYAQSQARPQPRFSGRLAMGDGNGRPLAIDMSAYEGRLGEALPSANQGIDGMKDAPRPGAVPRGEGVEYAGNTVSGLAADLRNALGLTQRQGRLSMKRALGEYDTGSGVIRTKAVQELNVLAHEATHALEYQRSGPSMQAALATHADELKAMAYEGAARNVLRQEGFAEFGRLYLTNPVEAQRRAPNFYQAFEQAMASDAPDIGARMKAIQDGYQNLLRSDSIEVAKASIAYTGSKGPVRDLVEEAKVKGIGSVVRRLADSVYTAMLDDKNPVRIATRRLERIYLENTGAKLELRPSKDPYVLSRLTPDAGAAGLNDILHGVTPYQGLDPEGVSLADALDTAGLGTTLTGQYQLDALREFDAYLIARRLIHEWDRFARGELEFPPDRNTRQFHEQVIADAEASHPEWSRAAGQVYEWLGALWKKEFEAGLITRESYEHGLTAHPDYVPLMRDVSDKGAGRGGKPRGALQFAGGVQQFEGSTRDILSPLSTMMQRAYQLNAIIKRNDVMKALDDLADAAGPGGGAIVERLPAQQIEAFTINAAEALRKTADELGLSGRDIATMQKWAEDAEDTNALVQMFRQTEFSPAKGEAVVFVWRDGKKAPLLLPDGEFGKSMFDALTGMNKELRNVVVDAMAAGTQTLRYGVTLSPEFWAANLIRDALATWINSGTGFVPVVDTLRGGAEALRGGQDAIRYGSAGGMRGGANVAALRNPIPRNDLEAQAQLQVLQRKGFKLRQMTGNPLRALAEATDLSETATRLGVFKRGFAEAKREGLSDYDALIRSTFIGRDYMDFGRRGSKMVAAARVVTFLNAALQGLDKTTRVLSANGSLHRALAPLMGQPTTVAERQAYAHAAKAWAKVSALGALGLGLRMLYQDDPEYQEIGDQLRATNWIFRSQGQWVFVPKPFELATLSNVLERTFEGVVMRDPMAGERLLSDLAHTVLPPHEIPSLAVPVQIASNRDHLGRPIVPDHLRGSVDPALQFNGYTSDLGKLIGKTFNVSPAVVDHVVTGFGGSLGRYVLQGSNMVGEAVTGRPRTAAGPEDMFLARRFVREISRGSSSQAEFWDQVSRDGGDMTQAEGSYRALIREGKDQEAADYYNRLPPQERAYIAAKTMLGDGWSIVHPLVRVQKSVSTLSDFRRDLREGQLRDETGAVIPLSPEDRRDIDGAVADLAMVQMRNALGEAGIKGWGQRAPMDPSQPISRIARTSPAAHMELARRAYLSRVPSPLIPQSEQAAAYAWAQMRGQLEAQREPRYLIPFIRAQRFQNGDRSQRYQEMQRMAGGAYSQ